MSMIDWNRHLDGITENYQVRTNTATDRKDGTTLIKGQCVFTGKDHSVVVPTSGLHRFIAGEPIQNAMPDVSADDREFIISGISPKGWDDAFGGNTK